MLSTATEAATQLPLPTAVSPTARVSDLPSCTKLTNFCHGLLSSTASGGKSMTHKCGSRQGLRRRLNLELLKLVSRGEGTHWRGVPHELPLAALCQNEILWKFPWKYCFPGGKENYFQYSHKRRQQLRILELSTKAAQTYSRNVCVDVQVTSGVRSAIAFKPQGNQLAIVPF